VGMGDDTSPVQKWVIIGDYNAVMLHRASGEVLQRHVLTHS